MQPQNQDESMNDYFTPEAFFPSNFSLKVNRAVDYPDTPVEQATKATIEIDHRVLTKNENLKITVAGKELPLRNQPALDHIVSYVKEHLQPLIDMAKNNEVIYFDKDKSGRSSIEIKFYNLSLTVNYTFGKKGTEICDKFIDDIAEIIVKEGDKTIADIHKEIEEQKEKENPELYHKMAAEKEEYLKLSRIFASKFGREPYLPANGGGYDRVVKAIKTCLEKNEDIYDDLIYPDKNVLY